jgi:hypothetical protein
MESIDLIVIGSGRAAEKGAAQAPYFGKRVASMESWAARASTRARCRARRCANRSFIFLDCGSAGFTALLIPCVKD